jgi:hypothetical protein
LMSAHPICKSMSLLKSSPHHSWFPKPFLQLYYSVSLAPSTDLKIFLYTHLCYSTKKNSFG